MKKLKIYTKNYQYIYGIPVNGYLKNSGINFNPAHDS